MPYIVLGVIVGYAIVGLLFAIAFAARGARALDPNVDGAPWTFRLIIAPGAAALWPLLAARWARKRGEP